MNTHETPLTLWLRNRITQARQQQEHGAALLTTVLMIALITTLTLTLATITITNLESAKNAQQAGSAVNAADAGISQALVYIRTAGVATINECSPNCTSEPYGNRNNPARITINGKAAQSYKVWIQPIAPYPANKPGIYRIHSEGIAGGPAGRKVTIDVELDSYKVPKGILANSVTGGGDAGVHRTSIFSTGCVYKRSKIVFDGIDLAYGIPAAVHSTQVITDSQGSGKYCPNTQKPIHDPGRGNGNGGNNTPEYCNTTYPYDEDINGGPLNGTPCYDRARAEFGNLPQFNDPNNVAYNYPSTSLLNGEQDLFDRYGLQQPPFTQSQLDQLRTIAISQNNYHRQSAGWASPTDKNAVMYFDLSTTDPGGRVDLNDLVGWERNNELDSSSPACTDRSLVVIIEGGNARLNSNRTLFGSIFLISDDPYGKIFKANGTSKFTGTLYSNELDLTGTADMYMDECFLNRTSPALFNLDTFNYRELDR